MTLLNCHRASQTAAWKKVVLSEIFRPAHPVTFQGQVLPAKVTDSSFSVNVNFFLLGSRAKAFILCTMNGSALQITHSRKKVT